MDKKELFGLRDKMLEFDYLGGFYDTLKKFFEENFEFPMIVGHKDFENKKWEIKKLNPLNISDRLTIESYIEGINKIVEDSRTPNKFRGMIRLGGVESTHYSKWDSHIFSAAMRFENSALYCLRLYFSSRRDESGNDKMGYASESIKDETVYDEIMSNFLGPNKKYKRILG